MRFKAKLFKLGNSKGIYIPKEVYTNLEENREYEWELYIQDQKDPNNVYTSKEEVITEKLFNTEMCKKHPGSMKGTCGCE